MYKDLSTPTKTPQGVRKRDNKVRTFAPKDSKIDSSLKDFEINSLPKSNKELNSLKNLREEYQNISEENNIPNLNEITNTESFFFNPKKLEKLNPKYTENIMKNKEFYEYELSISDSRIKYFDEIIKENPEMSNKKIDIINQLKSLYVIRRDCFKVRINNPKSKKADLKSLDDEIRKLEDEFRNQKGSGTFTYQNKFAKLLTLLTQLPTKNNSKNLKMT